MLSQNKEKEVNIAKPILLRYKKIIDFTCYVKVEKGGIDITKNFSSCPSKVFLVEKVYKISEDNKVIFKIEIKNISDQEYFSCDIINVERVIERMIPEGKMSIVLGSTLNGMNSQNEKINIFFFKTTREILENFLKHFKMIKSEQIKKSQISSSLGTKNQIVTNTESLETVSIIMNKKRKLKELYAAQKSQGNNFQLKKFKNSISITKGNNLVTKKKLNLIDLPEDLCHNLFDYVDISSLIKVTHLNKECKKMYDSYIERLKIRDDTPSRSLNKLLNRFQNLKELNLGQGKYIKNENFKNFDVSLQNLNSLNLSGITNLNDSSIRKLLSKVKSSKLFKLKLNFFLDSLSSAINYVSEFFTNINEFQILEDYSNAKLETIITNLEKLPRVFNPSFFNIICDVLDKKIHLKLFSVFVFNMSVINSIHETSKDILKNLRELNISIVIITKACNLKFLKSAVNVETLKINCILECETFNNLKKLKKVDFSNTNNYENLDPEEQLRNLNLDLDNDYVDIFVSIFAKMKKLNILSLGDFVNIEILKVINLFCKNINCLTLNSNKIDDKIMQDTLTNLKQLKNLDLRGCDYILGTCFTEIEDFPFNLLNVKLSLQSFNFASLIQFLKNKGIKAENYLYKNKY
jgi:hypothetical protein